MPASVATIEVKESVACLDNKGPDDLRALVITFASNLLVQTGKTKSLTIAGKQAVDCLNSGAPRAKWDEMIKSGGGNEMRKKSKSP